MARHDVPVKGIATLAGKWIPSRISTADSSYTEAEPQPGTMETAETEARLVPQLTGAQTVGAHLVVSRTGEPGVGISSALLVSANADLNASLGPVHTGEVGYYLDDGAETVDDLRGFDPPIKVVDFRMPGALPQPDAADAAMLPLSGKVAMRWTCASGGVRFAVWSPYDSSFENYSALTGTRDAPGAVVCVPGTERILLVYPTFSIYSDDYGATWGQYSRTGPQEYETELGTPTYEGKIRAAFDGAHNLLWAATDTTTGDLHLFASADLGASWALIEAYPAADCIDWDLSAAPDGQLYLAVIDSSNVATLLTLGGAFTTPSTATVTTVFSDTYGSFTTQQIWVAVDHNNAIWVYAEDDVDEGWWRAAVSVDGGITFFDRFVYPVIPRSYFWNAGDGAKSPGGWRLVPNAAGGFVAACCFGPVGAGVQHGGMAILGGFTSPQPVQRQFGRAYVDGSNTHKDRMWVGYGRPEDVAGGSDYTKTGAATTTHSSSDGSPVSPLGYVKIDSGAGAAAGYYEADLGDNGVIGAHGLFCLSVSEDGGSGQGIAVRYTLDDTSGNRACQVAVHFTETGLRVRDVAGAAWFAAEVAHDFTERTFVSISIDTEDETVEVLYRHEDSRVWQRVFYDSVSFVTATTSTDVGHVEWGQVTGVANAVSRWWMAQAAQVIGIAEAPETDGESYEGTSVAGVSASEDYGYPIPELWDAEAERPCFVRLRGSVGVEGESYSLPVLAGYPIEATFPTREPSPERAWRTAATGVEQRLAVDLGRDTRPGAGLSLLWLFAGCNARYWRVSAKEDGGSSYTTLGTADLATGFGSVGFARYGEVVVPASGGAGSRYLASGETRGGHIILDIGGTPVTRRIKTNTPGFFDASATGPRATLLLEGIDGTEPTTGLATIVWPSGVLALHGALESGSYYRYWRVSCLSTNESPESYYTAGIIAPFALRPTGKQCGNGWEISYEPNVRATRDARGTERRDQLGPPRRILTQSWDHGAKVGRLRGTDADYLGIEGKAALVGRDDVWWVIEDLLRESDGGARPVLSIFTEIADGATLNDPNLFLYSYLTGAIRTQHATGEEGVNEFVRTGPLRLEEIV